MADGTVKNTALQPAGPFDTSADIVANEVQVKAADGAMVPMSIIHKKGVKLDGSNPTLLYGYGAYGITDDAVLPHRLAWLTSRRRPATARARQRRVRRGMAPAAGYKATKPNTWKDFIACARIPGRAGYTSPAKLAARAAAPAAS